MTVTVADRRERWRDAWAALGAGAPHDLLEDLERRWSGPDRRYHDLRHLDECLAAASRLDAEAVHPAEVDLAIFFHDAIQDPQVGGDEARSADLAHAALVTAGVAPQATDRIAAAIRATDHRADPAALPVDSMIVVDADLAILAAAPARFAEYERDVRHEYAWVDESVFRRERRRILEAFLLRPRIYGTPTAHASFDAAARRNLRMAIDGLAAD